jgi:hypothetical protein
MPEEAQQPNMLQGSHLRLTSHNDISSCFQVHRMNQHCNELDIFTSKYACFYSGYVNTTQCRQMRCIQEIHNASGTSSGKRFGLLMLAQLATWKQHSFLHPPYAIGRFLSKSNCTHDTHMCLALKGPSLLRLDTLCSKLLLKSCCLLCVHLHSNAANMSHIDCTADHLVVGTDDEGDNHAHCRSQTCATTTPSAHN